MKGRKGVKLSDVFKSEGFRTLVQKESFLRGKKLLVVGAIRNGANVARGDILYFDDSSRITSSTQISSAIISNLEGDLRTNNVLFSNLELLNVEITQESIKEEIDELMVKVKEIKEEISGLRRKSKFMKEKNLDVFDEDSYKTYLILSEINSNKENLGSYELAEAITKMIKG